MYRRRERQALFEVHFVKQPRLINLHKYSGGVSLATQEQEVYYMQYCQNKINKKPEKNPTNSVSLLEN